MKINNYNIKLRKKWNSPEENSQELIRLTTQDFNKIQKRTQEANVYIGRFFSLILLLESKLDSLLHRYEPSIPDRTLGYKINRYEDLIRQLRGFGKKFDCTNDYQDLIGPLKELKDIRDSMAHNFDYIFIPQREVRKTEAYLKKERPDLYEHQKMAPKDCKVLVLLAGFIFVFSFKSAMLRQYIR